MWIGKKAKKSLNEDTLEYTTGELKSTLGMSVRKEVEMKHECGGGERWQE